MGFEKFEASKHEHEETTKTYSKEPVLTLTSAGVFSFNKAAITAFELNGFKNIILYYDDRTDRMAFELTNEADKDAIRLRNYEKSSSSIQFVSKSFVRKYGLSKQKQIKRKGKKRLVWLKKQFVLIKSQHLLSMHVAIPVKEIQEVENGELFNQ